MDSHKMTLSRTSALANPLDCAHTKNASANRLESALAKSLDLKPPGINTCKNMGGSPPVHRFRTASEKTAGGTRALRSFPLTFWRDACTISASSPKSLIAVVRAAGDGRRGTHHGHRDDYSSSLPQLH